MHALRFRGRRIGQEVAVTPFYKRYLDWQGGVPRTAREWCKAAQTRIKASAKSTASTAASFAAGMPAESSEGSMLALVTLVLP